MPLFWSLGPPPSHTRFTSFVARAEQIGSCKVSGVLEAIATWDCRPMPSHRPERGHSARRVVLRSPCCAESRRSGRVSKLKIRNDVLRPSGIFVSGTARYVPRHTIGSGAISCASRAKSNASWNENFIQHCKMQEAASLAERDFASTNRCDSCGFPWRSSRATRACARLRPLA